MKKHMKKIKNYLPSIILLLLVICTVSVGVVYAKYIKRETATKINLTVDAYGQMDITLCKGEDVDSVWTNEEFDIIPGLVITYDPTIHLAANNEIGYIFVMLKAENDLSSYVSYTMENGWKQGDGTDIPSNVYWRSVSASETEQYFGIVSGGTITIPADTVTEATVSAIDAQNKPTLTITAYSCNSANLGGTADTADQAALAWKEVDTLYNTSTP